MSAGLLVGLLTGLFAGGHPASARAQDPGVVRARTSRTLDSLLFKEDTDGDKRITVNDGRIEGTDRGNKRFWIQDVSGHRLAVTGTYFLSNLLQELTLQREAGRDTALLASARVFEPPADRISRMIRELFWDGLTRRIDESGLPGIFADEKTTTVDGRRYVFVPRSDSIAAAYFDDVASRHPGWRMEVVHLPETITPRYVRRLDGYHGILTLGLRQGTDGKTEGVPFVVPGGRFNEMYGWDSYFIALGLLHDNRVELARAMVDNFIYEIRHYGAILNANRTYYLTRSQPPFLTSMALAVYGRLPRTGASKAWLRTAIEAAILEYHTVWMNSDRLTATGLSRYYDTGTGPPPEAGEFDDVMAPYARAKGMDLSKFDEAYRSGRIASHELDEYFTHDRAMRESGHDTSYRLVGACADLVTVDLNSLLYKYETDIAGVITKEFGGKLRTTEGSEETAAAWRKRAASRLELMNKYLWDGQRGMFFDYNIALGRRNEYVSATAFYPLWARVATDAQAASIMRTALPLLEMAGGLAGSSEASRGAITPEHPLRQWDYPFGWSPHQMLAWQGLLNYRHRDAAIRLAYKWLFTITGNAAQYNGTVPEKFDVVGRTHEVFAEYGNVGTQFSYITREGFGWTNTSYQIGLDLLAPALREKLDRLIPPEWIFPNEN